MKALFSYGKSLVYLGCSFCEPKARQVALPTTPATVSQRPGKPPHLQLWQLRAKGPASRHVYNSGNCEPKARQVASPTTPATASRRPGKSPRLQLHLRAEGPASRRFSAHFLSSDPAAPFVAALSIKKWHRQQRQEQHLQHQILAEQPFFTLR